MATTVGEHRCQNLPDLSQVCVNTNTTLRLHVDSNARSIELLSGEASFRVRHDSRPFEVRSGSLIVHDLSTGFSVYRKGNSTIVTVIEGQVAIVTPHTDLRTAPQFHELQQAVFDEAAQSLRRRPDLSWAELSRLLSWQDGRIDLNGTKLDAALEEFCRYYAALEFRYPASLRKVPLGGSMKVGNLDDFLDALDFELGTRHTKASIRGTTVVTLSRPSTPGAHAAK